RIQRLPSSPPSGATTAQDSPPPADGAAGAADAADADRTPSSSAGHSNGASADPAFFSSSPAPSETTPTTGFQTEHEASSRVGSTLPVAEAFFDALDSDDDIDLDTTTTTT
ncbi:unnamed protein product, partial [Laminaria digitata]